MNYSASLGIALPEERWVPSPTYVLRRAAILDWLEDLPAGRVIEFGCGPGALLVDLSRRGFSGIGVERSQRSVELSRIVLSCAPSFSVASSPEGFPPGSADYLLAFEVLEHIEDDAGALNYWLSFLRPGGAVLISLPAHSRRWNATDVQAGHYRRYDRPDVDRLIVAAGLEIERVGTYGWPLTRLIELVRERVTVASLRRRGIDPQSIELGDAERTMASGFDRTLESRMYRAYSGWIGRMLFTIANWIQRMFYHTELGISFLVLARKPAGASSSSDCKHSK